MASQNQEPGQGTHYEVVLPALVALRLCTDTEVHDFEMQLNKNPDNNKTSKFDDVTLKIDLKSGDTLYFAIQLKHGEKSYKKLQANSFVSGKAAQDAKGDFLLNMYCRSSFCDNKVIDCTQAKCLTPNGCVTIHCEKMNCKLPHRRVVQIDRQANEFNYILYTNKGFDLTTLRDDFEFRMTAIENCQGGKYFRTGGKIYKFEVNKVNDHTSGTDQVWREDYEMFFEKFSFYVGQDNAEKIEKTIEDEFEKEFGLRQAAAIYINFFRHCHANMYVDRKINKEMVRIQLLELLLPKEKLAFDPKLKFFEQMTKSVNITVIDEDYSSVCQNYCTNWNDKITIDKKSELPEHGKLLEDGQRKNLIEKTVRSLDTESTVRTLLYHYEYPIIIRYENRDVVKKTIELCGLKDNLHFVLIGRNISTSFSDAKIFRNLSEQKLSDGIYNELKIGLRKNKSFLLKELIASDNNSPMKYISVANMLQMFTRRYHLAETVRCGEDYFPRQIRSDINGQMRSIRDSEIANLLNDQNHQFNQKNYLISGVPGAGKTELLKYLAINWPFDHYTVYINLKENQCSPDSCLNNFLDVESTRHSVSNKLKEILRDKKQIMFFFDALDEAFDKSGTIKCLKVIGNAGFKFLVAARSSIKNDLQQDLTLQCLEIEEFEKSTQDSYIRWKMNSRYDDVRIRSTMDKIRSIGRTRVENDQLVALPFYLNMLIDIFNDDETGNTLEFRDEFVVTDMYRLFTDGTFAHFLKKQKLISKDFPALEFLKYYFWQQYEKTAIESCFGSVLTMRHSDDSYYNIFLNYIEDRKEDPLGIVCTRDDGSLEFLHRNYAEYFVALWISKNFYHVHNLKNVIGGEENANIRYFLDLELTERHPLFLAVLHKDQNGIEKNADSIHNHEDKSKRNVLHLACSQMPGSDRREEMILEAILRRTEDPRRLNKRDELYRLTPVEYCEVFNFPTYAAVLRKYQFSLSEDMLHRILDYAISKNSPYHLQELMEDGNGELQLQIQNYLNANQNSLLKSVCNNYFDIVHLLLPTRVGLELQDDMGKTPLYYAITNGLDRIFVSLIAAGAENHIFHNNFTSLQLSVACGRLEMCTYLVRICKIPIDDKKNGFTALHIAILNHRTEVLKLLVNELNASVDVSCQLEANFPDNNHISREILGPRWIQIKSEEPRSALDLAIDCEYSDCIGFLEQKNAKKIKYS